MKPAILLLEDDANLGFILREHLELQGYRVDLRTNGEEGLRAFRASAPDLCLVDIMMPRKDGFAFARDVRSQDTAVPIIFLTAKAMKEDKLEGFRIGGDDYITKPFSMEELLLRIRAVLKRTHATPEEATVPTARFTIGSYTFETATGMLQRGTQRKKLTTKEADLLAVLCSRQGEILDRDAALRAVWGADSVFQSRSMDVYVSRLRKLLDGDPAVRIVTVHGKGLRLVVMDGDVDRRRSRKKQSPLKRKR